MGGNGGLTCHVELLSVLGRSGLLGETVEGYFTWFALVHVVLLGWFHYFLIVIHIKYN